MMHCPLQGMLTKGEHLFSAPHPVFPLASALSSPGYCQGPFFTHLILSSLGYCQGPFFTPCRRKGELIGQNPCHLWAVVFVVGKVSPRFSSGAPFCS